MQKNSWRPNYTPTENLFAAKKKKKKSVLYKVTNVTSETTKRETTSLYKKR